MVRKRGIGPAHPKQVLLAVVLLALVGAGAALIARQNPAASPQSSVLSPSSQAPESLLGAAPGMRQMEEADALLRLEQYWSSRVTYPTGKFTGAWLIEAAEQDKKIAERVPGGDVVYNRDNATSPLLL